MFTSKVFIVIFVLYNVASVYARTCEDCVLVRSCKNAMDLAMKVNRTDNVTRQKLRESLCGFEGNQVKVCCSDFAEVQEKLQEVQGDTIENHPNVKLLPKKCGNIEGYFFETLAARLYEFPWMALLLSTSLTDKVIVCEGTIINERYILTAAQCVRPPRNVTAIRIGEFDLSSSVDCDGFICESTVQDVGVEEIITHQRDIALVRVDRAMDFTPRNVAPICLPVREDVREVVLSGKTATVTGWDLKGYSSASNIIRRTHVSIRTSDDCHLIYSRIWRPEIDELDKILCAGDDRQSYIGNRGCPLMIDSDTNGVYRYIQYGILSYGEIYGPKVFTDITKYMNWILDNIKQ